MKRIVCPVAVAAFLCLPVAGGFASSSETKKDPGTPVLIKPRTQTTGCTLSPLPDRQCSPGAYAKKLTQELVCSSAFRTGDYRDVPQSLKHAVEIEYGMKPKKYGPTLEIDHIISLQLGGSNDIANLFPEKRDVSPGYKIKDKLENRLHDIVCTEHTMTLRQVQKAIANNWETLYTKVYGEAPN
jgi:hypothetical protein